MLRIYIVVVEDEQNRGKASHGGLTVWVIDDIIILADQLVGLLFILDHGAAAQLGILTLQLFAGKVLNDAGAQWVTQDIGGGPQAVTTGA